MNIEILFVSTLCVFQRLSETSPSSRPQRRRERGASSSSHAAGYVIISGGNMHRYGIKDIENFLHSGQNSESKAIDLEAMKEPGHPAEDK